MHNIKIVGKIEIYEENILKFTNHNIITNNGMSLITDLLKNKTGDYLDYIGVGTDNTPTSISDSMLFNELTRKQATNKTSSNNSLIVETLFNPSEAIGMWREAGIFNNSVGGVLFDRVNVNFNKTNKNVKVVFTINFING